MKTKLIYLILFILAAVMPFFVGGYLLHVSTTILIFMSLSLSWDMMLRTGQLSFGNAGFFGLGAYASLLTVSFLNFNPVLSIIFAGLFAALIAFIVGLGVLRLREIYFAITTLALAHVFEVVVMNVPRLTGGASGKVLPEAIFNGDSFKLYWLILGITILIIIISEYFENSKIHFAINSIRNDEIAASANGINVFKYLVFVFVVTSSMQGVIGGVYAQQYAFVVPESTFSLDFLLLPIAMALVGGIYSTKGPIIGAIILGLTSEYLKLVMPYGHLLVYGLIIIIVILFLPKGIYKAIMYRFKSGDYREVTANAGSESK
ncbi:MAG: branched-chain amino acid ABC transporter permease [Bacillota bacterium]